MASQVDIYNLALGRLRVGQAVADGVTSSAATICARFFDQCRQEVLRAFPWPCSLRAEALAEVADQTFPGWEYVYQFPTGCLTARCVADEGGMRIANSYVTTGQLDSLQNMVARQPFQLALKDDDSSQVILSDVPDAWVFYTYDLDTVGVFPPDLVSVIADRLAMEVGGPLQADEARIDRAERRYLIGLHNAGANAMNESREDARPESPSISCRM